MDNPFILKDNTIRVLFTKEILSYCLPFSCKNQDLDDFFSRDALLYDNELLGKTYAWLNLSNDKEIIAMATLANDSIKLRMLSSSSKNRLQRGVVNAKRGINYPAVLIGRLGVSKDFRGKGLKIGSQIIDFLKDWFRSEDNKTGCRFIVVDAYNEERTLRFYESNGFKFLYKNEEEERQFLNLDKEEILQTRFMYFDLKQK